jgi:hypothetical protein
VVLLLLLISSIIIIIIGISISIMISYNYYYYVIGFIKRGLPAPPGSNPIDTSGWAIAYDLQPDKPFPERG